MHPWRSTDSGTKASQPSSRREAVPGLGLHELQAPRKGTWAVAVSGNWRVTFRFVAPSVLDVDYEDYH